MRKLITVLAMSFGGLAALAGAGFAALLAVAGRQGARTGLPGGPGSGLQIELLIGSVLVFGLGFGGALIWAGWRAFSDARSRPLRLTGWGWLVIALGIVLVVGQVSFADRVGSARVAPLLPLLHVAAAVLPALVFISLAAWAGGRRGGWVGGRAVVASLAWGGLGATLLALVFETLLAVVLIVLVFLWLRATDASAITRLAEIVRTAQFSGQPPDLTALMPLLRSPVVILAVLAMLGLGAPLIEESAKALAAPLVALGERRLSRLDGFMYGVAAGAGFAVLEGSLYGALGLSSGDAWAPVMLLRAGTTAIHCFAAGLGGLGWQAILSERRWPRGLAFGALAVAVHGTWNLLAVGQSLVPLAGSTALGGGMAAALTVVVLGLMGLLWLAAVGGLPAVAGSLAGSALGSAAALGEAPLAPGGPAGDEERRAPSSSDLDPEVPPERDILDQ